MNNQKNRFWTLCFSFVPGAGEMYFGLYRQGASLMLLFIALFILPLALQLSPLALLAAVVWFYSFLHTHNLRALSPEEFSQVEDYFLWEKFTGKIKWDHRYQTVVAIALIVIGGYLLLDNLYSFIGWFMPDFMYSVMHRLPRLVIGGLIIALGLWLISGKKKSLEQEDTNTDFNAYAAAAPMFTSEFADAPHAPDVTAAAPEADAQPEETPAEEVPGQEKPEEDHDENA